MLFIREIEDSDKLVNACILVKVKAPIAGQSHEFFSKLEIYETLIAIFVYRIQTSKRTL